MEDDPMRSIFVGRRMYTVNNGVYYWGRLGPLSLAQSNALLKHLFCHTIRTKITYSWVAPAEWGPPGLMATPYFRFVYTDRKWYRKGNLFGFRHVNDLIYMKLLVS